MHENDPHSQKKLLLLSYHHTMIALQFFTTQKGQNKMVKPFSHFFIISSVCSFLVITMIMVMYALHFVDRHITSIMRHGNVTVEVGHMKYWRHLPYILPIWNGTLFSAKKNMWKNRDKDTHSKSCWFFFCWILTNTPTRQMTTTKRLFACLSYPTYSLLLLMWCRCCVSL